MLVRGVWYGAWYGAQDEREPDELCWYVVCVCVCACVRARVCV